MLFNNTSFKALEFGASVAWAEQEIHLQNISNISTPKYKAKTLSFNKLLESYKANDGVLPDGSIKAAITDNPALSNRPDENNIDIEVENMELYKAYVRYGMVLDKIKGEFNKISYVNNSGMR